MRSSPLLPHPDLVDATVSIRVARKARKWWLVLVGAAMLVLLYGYVSNDLLQRPVS
jgi:hypothetical protein